MTPKRLISAVALAAQLVSPLINAREAPAMPAAPIVFFDIAGPDTARLAAFYETVFGWDINAKGGFTTSVQSPLPATLRKDPADKVLYIGVEDITATLARVTANGGTIHSPRFEVKGVVILGLFRDPAGNLMGLVEMEGGKAKAP